MAKLIAYVRELIGDPPGADQVFSDDQIQRSLDIHRWEFRYLPLKSAPTRVGGMIKQLDWYSFEQYWEDDATLYDASYNQLTPLVSDPFYGRWSFGDHQDSVVATGKVYDPYGAAADLLEMWAGKSATEFDFEADGASYKRSQKAGELQKLAGVYRRQQRIVGTRQVRNDLW